MNTTQTIADARLELVEFAWHEMTKGELFLTPPDDVDRELASTVLKLWQSAEEFTSTFDVEQNDIEQFGDRAIANRVAEALHIIWYGAPHG